MQMQKIQKRTYTEHIFFYLLLKENVEMMNVIKIIVKEKNALDNYFLIFPIAKL